MLPEQKNIENLHSVKIAINAKGHYSFEIKVYDLDELNAFKRAMALSKSCEEVIREKNQ